MAEIIAIRSGESVPITGYYHLSGPLKQKIFLKRGQSAPLIEKVSHVWFFAKRVTLRKS
ncbi:hypothetical protein N9W34_04685 [Rickettsiales bacterium]|nr:hypothetical protein [Rickettsiales bacterium]